VTEVIRSGKSTASMYAALAPVTNDGEAAQAKFISKIDGVLRDSNPGTDASP